MYVQSVQDVTLQETLSVSGTALSTKCSAGPWSPSDCQEGPGEREGGEVVGVRGVGYTGHADDNVRT